MLCSTEGWLLVYIATQPSILLHNMSPYLPTIMDWFRLGLLVWSYHLGW